MTDTPHMDEERIDRLEEGKDKVSLCREDIISSTDTKEHL